MQTYTCHVTRSDLIPRRIEVQAQDRDEAIRKALAGHPGSVSCRDRDHSAFATDVSRRSSDAVSSFRGALC
jgi:hypothetical protein